MIGDNRQSYTVNRGDSQNNNRRKPAGVTAMMKTLLTTAAAVVLGMIIREQIKARLNF